MPPASVRAAADARNFRRQQTLIDEEYPIRHSPSYTPHSPNPAVMPEVNWLPYRWKELLCAIAHRTARHAIRGFRESRSAHDYTASTVSPLVASAQLPVS